MHHRALYLLILLASPLGATSYWISPTGDNANNGLSSGAPKLTFANVFAAMSAGDTLNLLDGNYTLATNGVIGYDSLNGMPPSGTSTSNMTIVQAVNPGAVTITGSGSTPALFLGRTPANGGKKSYVKIQGITFENGGSLFNTSYVYVKDCGFHSANEGADSVFGIGTNDHTEGNTMNLIEDCWIWGSERLIASNYRASSNVWRRVVVRGDGCDSASCTGSGNPNVGITVYESTGVSMQNVMVVDRILGGGYAYANFATAQHTVGGIYNQYNEWLGCVSLKGPDTGFYFEADYANSPTVTLKNCVAWDNAEGGFDVGGQSAGSIVQNCTAGVSTAYDGFRGDPAITGGTWKNLVSYDSGRYGINSPITPTYSDVYDAVTSAYNQTTCSVGCLTTNPLATTPPAILYPPRIETGSTLKGTGDSGDDYGANIIYKYGTDGTFAGDSGYNTLSANALWPWPNEARIKTQMSVASARGFCADTSLTNYVFNYLGNGNPYGSSVVGGHFGTGGPLSFQGTVSLQ